MESQQAVQTPAQEKNQDKGISSHYPSYRRTAGSERAYSDSFRLTSSRPTQPPVAPNHSATNRSVAKGHHYTQSQVVSSRRQGYKGKNKTYPNHRQKESDTMIQKLLDLVKEVHKSGK
ncbi:hypothetical protein O181_000408 [Austropuccinia psidii MF-1]|uniref:Uncharacterized protein n=1 Tax=Austropuccinia psidii MF-1 TaxID=1389203 RepID=A0A9Q3B8S7_9BASI|nr:hypothetical protein [Austropuccinia psidii MF-1]